MSPQGLKVIFIERELKLLGSIFSEKALDHHLEPSYYAALKKAIDISSTDNSISTSEVNNMDTINGSRPKDSKKA